MNRYITSLLLAATLINAAPAPHDIKQMRKQHRVTQVQAGKALTGPHALYHAYQKHGIPIHRDLELAVQTTPPAGAGVDTGNANTGDNGWLFPVTFGTTKMNVIFDTGSADLWGFSTLTPKAELGAHKNLYNPNATGTKLSGETFDVSYVTGAASGVVYQDKVVAGSVTATAAVGAATKVPAFITNSALDGIMGFAFINGNTCSPNQCTPFVDVAIPKFPQPLWGVALRHGGAGTWDFGFIDTSLYTGSIVYTEQMNYPYEGSWGIFVQGFSIATKAQTKENFYTLVDTGTTLLLVFDDLLNAYYAPVTGATYDSTVGGIVFPCSSTSKLPNLNFFIDGQMRTMPGSYGLNSKVNSTWCYGALQSNANAGNNIFGDTFLKSQYVVFNPHTNVVGFAQQVNVTV